jgi:hypothetical protein
VSERIGRTVVVAIVLSAISLAFATSMKADDIDQFGPWSAPVNLGPDINSTAADFFPSVSKDGLSLYFSSVRPDGFGGWDIYVSQRISVNDSWGAPHNLGATINTAANEGRPSLSPDGHVLYFSSTRAGGFGGNDIWASRRRNKRDDFGWQEPENLGSGVNTAFNEASPNIFEDDASGVTTLYFDSNRPGGLGPFTSDGANNGNDIYASVLQPNGTFGPATLVEELSTPSTDRQPNVRRDGLEMFLASDRPATGCAPVGCQLDLWVSTRPSTSSPWSPPVSLGPTVNSPASDAGPALSFDGLSLYFQSIRLGPSQSYDLYVTTREKLKGGDSSR